MEWFSTQLKQKREELGLSIEDVVEKTKLHPSVIRDLEAGNFQAINPIYLKGFIKIYAGFLGIEASQALEEVSVSQAATSKSKVIRKEPGPIKRRREISPQVKRILIYAIAAIIALWGFINVVRFTVNRIGKIFSRKPAITKTKETKPQKPQVASQELIVSLTAKRAFFLRVNVDGKLLFEGILNKGAVESWEADEKLEFKISDGSAAYVEVNGQPLPPLTTMRKPIKRLTVTRSGISVEK